MGTEQVIAAVANYPEFNPDSTVANTTYVVTTNKAVIGTKAMAANITLIFAGGKLLITRDAEGRVIPGGIKANNTFLIAPVTQIFDINLDVTGSWIMDRAYPQWFGARNDAPNATDVSYDAAPAINKAIQFKSVGEVFIPRGQYVIKDSIRVKYGIILCGEVAGSCFRTGGSDVPQNDYVYQGTVIRPLRSHTLDGNYMIIVNAERKSSTSPISPSNSNWIVSYPNEQTVVKELYLLHLRNDGESIVENIKGIIYAGSVTIEHCRFRGLVQGATSNDQYSDKRIITHCDFNPESVNSGEKYYAFDFYSSGEAVCFRENAVNVWKGCSTALLGALGVNIANSGEVCNNILNHNVFIKNSKAILYAANHMESNENPAFTAQLQIQTSVVDVNGNFFEKSAQPSVRLTGANDPGLSLVTLSGNSFCYYENESVNRTISAYEIETDGFINLKILNTYRCLVKRDTIQRIFSHGIMICDLAGTARPEFNDYSYCLSKDGMLLSSFCVNCNNSANTTSGLSLPYVGLNSNVRWKAASGTYTYQAQVMWDIKRKVVGKKIAIGTFSPTLNGNGLMVTFGGLDLCGFNCIIRIYRQKGSEKMMLCDIPFCGSKNIYDNGLDVCGYKWREEVAADSLTNALEPIGSIQFAGNNIICNGSKQPTVGTWTTGDKVFNAASSGTNALWIYNGAWYAK